MIFDAFSLMIDLGYVESLAVACLFCMGTLFCTAKFFQFST